MPITRRTMHKGLGAALLAPLVAPMVEAASAYRGPNIVIVRFGGGVRRAETIEPNKTSAPYFRHVLSKRGTLFTDVRIDHLRGTATSHAEGTLNLLTGRYGAYVKRGNHGLAPLLEATTPTLFELARQRHGFAAHETLLVNGEDRPQEEFLTHGGHAHFGVAHRSQVIGLYRYRMFAAQRLVADPATPEPVRAKATKTLTELTRLDVRGTASAPDARLDAFWQRWHTHYGGEISRMPRGDRLLTELAAWALRELKPRLMMINYQDPDYVHWGLAGHYTRAISIIDQGLERLVMSIDSDPFYRDGTILIVVPDCGRDANPLLAVPFQHHFNTRAAHEIFAFAMGPRVPAGRVISTPVDQTSITATVGSLMGLDVSADGRVLHEVQT